MSAKLLFKGKKVENVGWLSKLSCFGGNYKLSVAATAKLSLDNEAKKKLIAFTAAPKLQAVFCSVLFYKDI